MDWFGLGIIFNAKDNASGNINRVNASINTLSDNLRKTSSTTAQETNNISNSVNNMSNALLTGLSMQRAGSDLLNVSGAMVSSLANIGKQAISTGDQFEKWRVTLKALYKDSDLAKEKLNWGMKLASETPFEMTDITEALIGFKAIGVEADTMFEGANGEMRSFLEYIGDLAALRPDVGLSGVMLGVRNLLGGDNGKSLRMRMDMDFEQIMGKEWGSSTDEIMSDLVNASKKIAGGLMTELDGTWSQMISNLKDQSTRFFLSIADNGAFDSAKKTLGYISRAIGGIDDEKMKKIGTNIAKAFDVIWKPIDFVIRKVVDFGNAIANLIAENPMVATFLTTLVTLVSGFTALMGVLLVVGGTFLIAVNGIRLFFTALGGLGGSLTFIRGKMLAMLWTMGKYAVIGALIGKAWKSDFGGIRTMLTNFMDNMKTAFSYSTDIVNMSTGDMIKALSDLDTSTFSGWLTYRLVQLKMLWIGLCDAWSDNTLSEENFQKLKALGLLPVIETILDLKAKSEAFFQGFAQGFKNVSDIVTPILQFIADSIKNIILFFNPVQEGIDGVNDSSKGIDLKPWFGFGEAVAYVVSAIAGLKVIITIVSIVGKIGAVIGFILTKIGAVLGFFGILATLPAWVVGLIAVAVVTMVALVIKYWDNIKQFAINVWTAIADKTKEIWNGIVQWVKNAWINIGGAIKTGWSAVVQFFQPVTNFFIGLGQFIIGVFQMAWNVVKFVTILVWSGIKLAIGLAWEGIKFIWGGVVTFFQGVWNGVVTGVQTAWTIISAIIQGVFQVVVGVWNTIVQVFSAIWNFIYTNIILPVWTAIQTAILFAYNLVVSIWTGIINFFTTIWNFILNSIILPIWSGITSAIQTAYSFVIGIWNGITTFFSNLWNGILNNIIQPVLTGIGTIVQTAFQNITQIWSGLTGAFAKVWGAIEKGASSLFSWLEKKFSWVTSIVDGIKGAFNSAKEGFGEGLSRAKAGLGKMVGLNTGGYVKTTGIAVLHPNEVVVNDDITQKLRMFLDSRDKSVQPVMVNIGATNTNNNPPRPLQPEEQPRRNENSDRLTRSITSSTINNQIDKSQEQQSIDNSVVFEKGSIQVELSGNNEQDVEKLFKTLMKRIEEEKRMRKTLNYNLG